METLARLIGKATCEVLLLGMPRAHPAGAMAGVNGRAAASVRKMRRNFMLMTFLLQGSKSQQLDFFYIGP